MSESWILLPQAIDRVAEAIDIPRDEAIELTIGLAKRSEVGSRIAVLVNRGEGQPQHDVRMNDAHWEDLEELDTDWRSTANAEFLDGYALRGIEIDARDLAAAVRTRGVRSRKKLQPVANPESTTKRAETDEDTKGDWLRIGEAIRLLHDFLEGAFAGQEPAPWIEKPRNIAQQIESETTLPHRQMARTSLTMRRALLSGDLSAHLVKDGRTLPLPGWAWENAGAAENAFNFDLLPLNPLLDHGLGDYEDWLCFVSRAEFNAWLSQSDIAEIGDLPTLPVPFDHDLRPDWLFSREPADRPFVDLIEAISWIAFSCSLSLHEYQSVDLFGWTRGADGEPHDRLRCALSRFSEMASAGKINVRGRYRESYDQSKPSSLLDTETLSNNQLRDFARFDVLSGGLVRGTGFDGELTDLGEIFHSKGDGWSDVEVNRSDLMKVFPKEGGKSQVFAFDANGRAPALKKGRPPSEEKILAKADEMKARGLDGRTIAKTMRHEPGFEHVATTEVRELIKGRYKSGGRPRKKSA